MRGAFRPPCWCGPEDLQFRLVQVGWVLGGCTKGEPIHTRKERLIKPQNFNISEDATNKHGITNADIKTNGLPLREVLEELMSAMWALHGAGGVVVSHHLEFDAGIIDEELQRCEMEEWRPRWKLIASNGICTLDLNVQEWFQTTSGRVKEPGEKNVGDEFKRLCHALLRRLSPCTRVTQANAHCWGRCRIASLVVQSASRFSDETCVDHSGRNKNMQQGGQLHVLGI